MKKEIAAKVLATQTTNTCVDRITLASLVALDISTLEKLRFLEYSEHENYNYLPGVEHLVNESGIVRYCKDNFCPRAGTVYLKPSYAGRQVVLGAVDGVPILSNGVWFSHHIQPKEAAERKAIQGE